MVAWTFDNRSTDLSGTANDPTHDASGNMTADENNSYIYDAWNRLAEVHDRVTEDLIATYECDGQKRRIEKTVDSTTEDIFYNSEWQILEVRTADDTDPSEQYIWDIRYVDAPVLRFQDANTDGDYADAEDNVLYYTNDANMNVTALVDESGTVVERYAYDPYGQVTVLDADWSTDADGVSDVNNEVLYAGYRFDPETGLFHVRNRYYSTSLGRFTARDPLGYVDGMSVYEYVGGNPIHYVDSLGERPVLMGPDGQPQDPPPTEEEMQRMLKLERQQRAKDRVDPMGLSSRKTKYWHVRGYGATKIKATFAGEIEHSVISVDMSDKIGVDYGPADKKGGKKGGKKKKVSGLAWLLWGETGKTDWTWNIQFPLDYNRTSEKWQLCIRNADTMKVDDKDVECKCATEDQIKTCITRVAKAWNGTTWKRGHDCRHFVQAAESECCLEKCSQ